MNRDHMTTSACLIRRSCRTAVLACALALACGLALAQSGGFQNSGSVIGDEVMYSIGGGNAVSMSGEAGMRYIGVGAGWNSTLTCGELSISTTPTKQSNGINNGLQNN